MRERLTLSFIALTVAAVTGALFMRSYALTGVLTERESREAAQQVQTVRLAVEQHLELRRPVDARFLSDLVWDDYRIEFVRPGQAPISVEGESFSATEDVDDDLSTLVPAGGGSLTLTQSGDVVNDLIDDDRRSILVLLLLVGVIAGLVGYVVARMLASPFRKLAVAGELLGRGRFDLELPRSRMVEVQAVSTALLGSAGRLQERLSREQDFAQHASHVLRTPLTGLRLELEELSLRDDLPGDAQETVVRSLDRIDSMNVVAGELVELSRRGALVAGSELPLRELATLCAQRWADTLAEHDRPLTAAVEGHPETTYTPGPVEHILDLLLTDVLRRGQGPVRMVFDSDGDGALKIRITCTGELKQGRGAGVEEPVNQARTVVTALGGRLTGENPADGLEILLPRR
ncbi:MAG: hypothetical protein LH468_00430 [Nocardioides sp.]|nr:hypothetical protein [Nocardioides sp.]